MRTRSNRDLNECCVVACDHVAPIPAAALGTQIGQLLNKQKTELTEAIHAAFDLEA